MVEQCRTLWDISAAEYKLPKTPVWKEISESFGQYTSEDCKAKWTNLRVSFKTNLAKHRASKSGQATKEVTAPVWKYFKQMLFLEANDNHHSTESTSIKSSIVLPSAVSDKSILNDLGLPEMQQPSTSGRKRKSASLAPQLSSSSSLSSLTEPNFKELAAKALISIGTQNDEYDTFGDYVASELRSLPAAQATFAKCKLSRALLDILDEMSMMPPQPLLPERSHILVFDQHGPGDEQQQQRPLALDYPVADEAQTPLNYTIEIGEEELIEIAGSSD